MVIKRVNPAWLGVMRKNPRSNVPSPGPGMVKSRGMAARTNGRTTRERLNKVVSGMLEAIAAARTRDWRRIKTGQAPVGVNAVVKIKKNTSTSLIRVSSTTAGLNEYRFIKKNKILSPTLD